MTESMLSAVRGTATRLSDNTHDYDPLMEQIGSKSLVLLGESTHGTSEFYRMRSDITRRLIEEKQFDAIAVEGDWPDVYRLNRFIMGQGGGDILEAFDGFERFPRWMWRNREMLELIQWLARYNQSQPIHEKVGIYGLDLYSLYRSARAVIDYLARVDPDQASIARDIYECLDNVQDPQRYGLEATRGLRDDCRQAIQQQLVALQSRSTDYLDRGELLDHDELFFAEQNATVVRNAESYYRTMFKSSVSSWNLRDAHMSRTLLNLQRHHRIQGHAGKVIVWAHNSHVGDARATEMGWKGELSLGQLIRLLAPPRDVFLVGFSTYTGRVAAAHHWDGNVENFRLNAALPDSLEHLFYRSGLDRFYLPLNSGSSHTLEEPLQERAVGVIYRPRSEQLSHYFHASLATQFDALFHLDETSALEPLDPSPNWHRKEYQHWQAGT
ncbi:MAG: erythromycin esterase family protein [Alcanivorax sp.]|nr:erythromycin esterase family protein [Alcanivorax sp.]